jgi:hypothetical protein
MRRMKMKGCTKVKTRGRLTQAVFTGGDGTADEEIYLSIVVAFGAGGGMFVSSVTDFDLFTTLLGECKDQKGETEEDGEKGGQAK